MTAELLDALNQALERREAVALLTVLRSPEPRRVGAKALVGPNRLQVGSLGLGDREAQVVADALDVLADGRHRLVRYDEPELEIFVEVLRRPPQLIIVGAGHIAAPLCEVASLCGFSVTVIDDRPQFANRDRFPQAETVIAGDIQKTVAEVAVGGDTYVVLVTRGHSLDVECLLEILDRPLAYIGMIGSRRRVQAVFDLLVTDQGIDAAQLERVYAPIGLPIAAETPAEIAVAIMAEIINVRRGGTAVSLIDERRRSEPPTKQRSSRNHPQRVARRR